MTFFEFIKYTYATQEFGLANLEMVALCVGFLFLVGLMVMLAEVLESFCVSRGWDVQALFSSLGRKIVVMIILVLCPTFLSYGVLLEPMMRRELDWYAQDENKELNVQKILDVLPINEEHTRATLQLMLHHRREVGGRSFFVYLNTPMQCLYGYEKWIKVYPDSDFFYHVENLRDMPNEQLERLGPATKEDYATCIETINSLKVLWKAQMNYEETCFAFAQQLKLKDPYKDACHLVKFPKFL